MRLFYLFLFLFGSTLGYGVPPPPPPPCNTPQCPSGTFCYSNTNLCTTCPAGYKYNSNPNVGVSNVNNWGCTQCSPGTFSPNSGSSSCTSCNPGTFQNQYGQTGCYSCPANYFNGGYGTISCNPCSSCPSGTWTSSGCSSTSDISCTKCTDIANCAVQETCSSPNDSYCSSCTSGYYLVNNQCNQCTTCTTTQYETTLCSSPVNRICTTCTNTCPIGQMLSGVCSVSSNPTCIICPSGSYKNTNDGSVCLPCRTTCSPGFQLNPTCTSSTDSVCIPCQSDFYKSTNDGSLCLPCTSTCNIGFQLNQACSPTINPICIPCSSGYYKDTTDGSSCQQCTKVCNKGMELNQVCGPTVNPLCVPCTSGFYKSIADGSQCLACTSGCTPGFELDQPCSTTINPVCIPCNNGFYSSNGLVCLPCTTDCGPGAYLTNNCIPTSNPGCVLCPANTANPNRYSVFITSCSTCPNGAISAVGSATCLQCPLGTATLGNNNCTNCSVGTYADTLGSISCKLCPSGTFNNIISAISLSNCIQCNTGYYSLQGASLCTACPIGSFGIVGAKSPYDCLVCPLGSYNNMTGQSSCILCPAGTANYNMNSSSIGACVACMPGTYSLDGASTCTQCPTGTSSYKVGASSCFINLPGTFTDSNGSTGATNCYPGYYSDIYGAISCKSCLPGFVNNNSGSVNASSCIPCKAGSFASNYGSSICTIVHKGYYQDEPGQYNNIPCPSGTFNNNIGSLTKLDCMSCSPGQYQSHSGSSNCIDCPSGFYQNASGQSSCIPCPVGTYNILNGTVDLSSCILCPVGFYSSTIAANSNSTCIATPLGSFINRTGSSNFTQCSPGTYQDNVAQTKCKLCSPGTFNVYSGSINSSICIPSPPGFYVPYPGSSTFISCNPGTFTDSSNNTHCKICVPGTYSDRAESTTCTPCPQGTFSLGSGFDRCYPIGNMTIELINITSTSAIVVARTNFTTKLPIQYYCSDMCSMYIGDTLITNGTGNQSVVVDIVLGVDTILVVVNGMSQGALLADYVWDNVSTRLSNYKPTHTFSSSLDIWNCSNIDNTTYCYSTLRNNAIISATLLTEKEQVNMYSDPNIVYSTMIENESPSQTYVFFLDNLEASVFYSLSIMLQVVNATIPYYPLISRNNLLTLPSVPTGPIQNLVKYFIGINSVEQASNEQSNLQVHWDPPLILEQHGNIIGYNIMYVQEEKTYITYGPNVEFRVIPSVEFIVFTNQTTVILTNLTPCTNYTITVYPMTKAIGLGPGTSIILTTQVSAPPKPPTPTFVQRKATNITVSWPSLTNETGTIVKAWIIAEPYEQNTSEVVHVPDNSDLPPLPFPHIGVRGFFSQYDVLNQCKEHLFGFTFRSLSTGNICGGICNKICEYGTPMLDPTTILPTNNNNLTNDFYLMEFNTVNGTGVRLVPYLSMKKRFVLNISNGGLNLAGKVLLGDGLINPNSQLNNTKINESLSYRIRLIVFTSEVLYTISDPLEISPFQAAATSDLIASVYIGIIVAVSIVMFLVLLFYCCKKKCSNYNVKKMEISNTCPVDNPMYWEIQKMKLKEDSTRPSILNTVIYSEPNSCDMNVESKYLDVSTNQAIYNSPKDMSSKEPSTNYFDVSKNDYDTDLTYFNTPIEVPSYIELNTDNVNPYSEPIHAVPLEVLSHYSESINEPIHVSTSELLSSNSTENHSSENHSNETDEPIHEVPSQLLYNYPNIDE